MSALPPAEARRLSASLNRLASPHDGEIVAAAGAAKRILHKHGLGFEALAAPTREPNVQPDVGPVSPWAPRRRPQEVKPNDHQALARVLLGIVRWTEWERGFLTSVSGKTSLSDKERSILRDLRRVVVR